MTTWLINRKKYNVVATYARFRMFASLSRRLLFVVPLPSQRDCPMSAKAIGLERLRLFRRNLKKLLKARTDQRCSFPGLHPVSARDSYGICNSNRPFVDGSSDDCADQLWLLA
jgi:hypothetical protein